MRRTLAAISASILASVMVLGVGLVSLTARPAYADDPHKEGEYGGVTPGHRPAKEKPNAKRPKPGALNWIGFSAKDGGAEVYFQSGGPFEVLQRVEGATLVVTLVGLKRQVAGTRRPVDTRFFDNPLARISAKVVKTQRASKSHPARAGGVEARISFKNPRDAREGALRTATEADGMFYAYLAFPEGSAVDEAPSTK